MHDRRLQNVREFLSINYLDAFLISKPTSLRYLLNFTGSNGLGLITHEAVFFITDFRYKVQAAKEISADEIILANGALIDSLPDLPHFNTVKKLGFESEHISVKTYRNLAGIGKNCSLLPFSETIDKIAAKKSPREIALIKKACVITTRVYKEIFPLFKEGVREIEIAAEISYRIRKNGGEGEAFRPIVLFGKRSAFPHGTPGRSVLRQSDVIQLDFGAIYRGYCADFSRVLVLGSPPDNLLKVYGIVKNALEQTIKSIAPGKPANEIDSTARTIIKEHGYAEYFGHAVGHGVGLDVHSFPKISYGNSEPLEEYNVVTLEPGIYIPNHFGVRIEDVVCIEESCVSVLTKSSRELQIL